VERYQVEGAARPAYYCVGTSGRPGNIFGVLEASDGSLGFAVSSTTLSSMAYGGRAAKTGEAAASGSAAVPQYAAVLAFEPGAPLKFDLVSGAPGYLVSSHPNDDPTKRERFARYLRQAGAVVVSGPQIGRLGRFDLSGSAAMLDQLETCAKG
jgi:hypothetical protein